MRKRDHRRARNKHNNNDNAMMKKKKEDPQSDGLLLLLSLSLSQIRRRGEEGEVGVAGCQCWAVWGGGFGSKKESMCVLRLVPMAKLQTVRLINRDKDSIFAFTLPSHQCIPQKPLLLLKTLLREGRSVSSPLCGNGKQPNCFGVDWDLIIDEQQLSEKERNGLQPRTCTGRCAGLVESQEAKSTNRQKNQVFCKKFEFGANRACVYSRYNRREHILQRKAAERLSCITPNSRSGSLHRTISGWSSPPASQASQCSPRCQGALEGQETASYPVCEEGRYELCCPILRPPPPERGGMEEEEQQEEEEGGLLSLSVPLGSAVTITVVFLKHFASLKASSFICPRDEERRVACEVRPKQGRRRRLFGPESSAAAL
ncbi:hypothetical protein CRENBAI_024571 [Crenichthys baileyi]|uniref:Uncharacterized protein n=1 Tax=Crenichthys baileyi TaxID=28760 RepID=A0AAV9QVY2_9TELE